MATVVESSPANAGSVEAWVVEVLKIVNGLSPANDLVTRKWYVLDVLGCLSWLDLLGPAAFTLAFLDITMLNKSIIIILIKYFVSEDAVACLQFTILHDLIVNIFGISVVNFLSFDALFALVNIDITVPIVNLVVH